MRNNHRIKMLQYFSSVIESLSLIHNDIIAFQTAIIIYLLVNSEYVRQGLVLN